MQSAADGTTGVPVESIAASLATLPSFLAYFAGGGALVAGFALLYTSLTPHREFEMIRAGNTAAAVAVTGALLGFIVPLASVIAHSARFGDVIVWGLIALIVQLMGYLAARVLLPGLPRAIAEGRMAEAIFLAGLSLGLGILDAACMAG
jgi:putative membrane protein